MPDYLRVLENAIQFGHPVVLQNVQENLDPSLNPVLNKSLTQIGRTHVHTPKEKKQTNSNELHKAFWLKLSLFLFFSFSGGRLLLKLGDKEVEYNPEFRFYVTTKLSNPHYTPEISSVTTIVNFAVKEQVCALVKDRVFCVFHVVSCLKRSVCVQGLEAQLLGIVVRKERPELEQQKDSLVTRIADGKKRLQDLEDEILRS